VPRFRGHLTEAGICGPDELDLIEERALAAVDDALAAVMNAGAPPIDELDRDVYANPIAFPV